MILRDKYAEMWADAWVTARGVLIALVFAALTYGVLEWMGWRP